MNAPASPVVFSPHTDDAIFSIGAHLAVQGGVIIATPFAGIPGDPVGRAKHQTLHREHAAACTEINAFMVNGPFLDDVYPQSPPELVSAWLYSFLHPDAVLYIPVGIHHPDHLQVSNLLITAVINRPSTAQIFFYEELPYRVDYPDKARDRLDYITTTLGQLKRVDTKPHPVKRHAVAWYASQDLDGSVAPRVLVEEHVWELL